MTCVLLGRLVADTLNFAALFSVFLGALAALAGFRIEKLRNAAWQFAAVGLGMLLKTVAIGMACSQSGNHFFNSASEMVGLLGWALGCSYLLALAVSAARSLGALVLPLVVALLALSQILNKVGADPGVPADSLLAIHIIAAFLGYGLFLTACGTSLLYLQQARLLKRKAFGVLFRDIPGLERLERLEMLCSWLGLASLTVAIVAGAMLARRADKPFWLEPKILATQLTWLIFGVLVVGRSARWLNGRLAAKFVLAGAALVLFTFALSHRKMAAVSASKNSAAGTAASVRGPIFPDKMASENGADASNTTRACIGAVKCGESPRGQHWFKLLKGPGPFACSSRPMDANAVSNSQPIRQVQDFQQPIANSQFCKGWCL